MINWDFVIHFTIAGVLGCITLIILDRIFNLRGKIDSFRNWLGIENYSEEND